MMRTLGRPDAAIDEARRAIDDLTPLGATLELARARAVLDAPDGEPCRRAALASDRKGLTPREIEILRLISTGLNNQAIAERLFISEHTVHRHVANTLTKLNVSSRSAAVAQAGRLGLLYESAVASRRGWPVRAIFIRACKMTRTGEAERQRALLHSQTRPRKVLA